MQALVCKLMPPNEALDKTIRMFGLKASVLAEAAGVKPSELSAFRRGHRNWGVDKLHKTILCLTPEQFGYFCGLIYSDEE